MDHAQHATGRSTAGIISRRFRLVDRVRSSLVVVATLLLGAAAMGAANALPPSYPAFAALLFVATIATAFVAASVHLKGTVFDPPHNRLSYPRLVLRGSVALPEITDVASQTMTGLPLKKEMSFAHGRTPGSIRRHVVDLSGAFGSRRLVFFSKYKRDLFLCLIQEYAPHVTVKQWAEQRSSGVV
jgi:hypothetical protein